MDKIKRQIISEGLWNKSLRRSILIMLGFLLSATNLMSQFSVSTPKKNLDKAGELKVMKENYISIILHDGKEELIKSMSSFPKDTIVGDAVIRDLMLLYPQKTIDIKKLLKTVESDGHWSDINYEGIKKSSWEPTLHVDRILELTRAYNTKSSSYYHSTEIAYAIHKTLGYWFQKKLICSNWWYNEIGIPKTLGSVFVLFEDQLSSSEKEEAIAVMNNSTFKMTGQNKVWLSGNIFIRALLQNDYDLAKQAGENILSEIVVEQQNNGSIEGIREDHSFHQHGQQQQFGNYGAAFISSMSFWAKVFSGTSFAINQDKLNILSDLINQGYNRILWKGYMDMNCLGRQFFQRAAARKASAVVYTAKTLSEIDLKNRAKYQRLIENNIQKKNNDRSINGLYHFWKSDQTIFRTPEWMTSIRMSSPGTLGGEAGNGDNLKGYYMSDGATYTYVDGDEYSDIFPLWDWRKLPGITAYESDSALKLLNFSGYSNQGNFVGNVNDGVSGLTTFQLMRDGLKASKSWILTNDFILCLGAGINTNSDSVVTSSIEQRLKAPNVDLLVLNNKKWEKTVLVEKNQARDIRLFHNKTGYIVLKADKLKATDEDRIGSWSDIMQTYPKEMIEQQRVISLWLDHGIKPQNSAYQYIIIPASTTQKVADFDLKSIQVLHNSAEKQVLYLANERKIYIAAYKPVDLKLPLKTHFKSNQAGLFLIQLRGKVNKPVVIASDPTEELMHIDISINGEKRQFKFNTK